jgi:hypothetical protein
VFRLLSDKIPTSFEAAFGIAHPRKSQRTAICRLDELMNITKTRILQDFVGEAQYFKWLSPGATLLTIA